MTGPMLAAPVTIDTEWILAALGVVGTVILTVIGFLINAFIGLRKTLKEELGIKPAPTQHEILPQPLTTQRATVYARQEDHARLEHRVTNVEAKIELHYIDLLKEGEKRAKETHNRIDTVINGVADMRAEMGELAGAVRQLTKSRQPAAES